MLPSLLDTCRNTRSLNQKSDYTASGQDNILDPYFQFYTEQKDESHMLTSVLIVNFGEKELRNYESTGAGTFTLEGQSIYLFLWDVNKFSGEAAEESLNP